MSLTIEVSTSIDRPPADVFAVLIDVPHHTDWAKGAGKILNVSQNPANLGTTWTQISKIVGKEIEIQAKVNVFETNRAFGFQTDKPIRFDMLFRTDPAGAGTKVTVTAVGEPAGFFGVATPLLRKSMKDQLSGDLRTLKAKLEART